MMIQGEGATHRTTNRFGSILEIRSNAEQEKKEWAEEAWQMVNGLEVIKERKENGRERERGEGREGEKESDYSLGENRLGLDYQGFGWMRAHKSLIGRVCFSDRVDV